MSLVEAIVIVMTTSPEDHSADHDAPRCDCSLGWRFKKGNGPDPAHCPVHGEPASVIPPVRGAQ